MGDALRRARQERGLSLEEASGATKIHARHLDAMERGDSEALPPFLYSRGFRKIYSSYLGINYDELLPTDDYPRSLRRPFRRDRKSVV